MANYTKKFTDRDLRTQYQSGKTPSEIAAIFAVAVSSVTRRIEKLQINTQAQLLQPLEAKHLTDESINALGQINKSLTKVNLLMDACDDWLRDANDPSRYDVGPRAKEVDVTYTVEIPTEKGYRYEKRKKSLAELLGTLETDGDGERISKIEKGEYKHADPRELILKTAQEARSTIDLAADLARMLVDHRSMQVFRDAVIKAINDCDPDKGREIAEAVRRTIVLHNALGGLETLSAPFSRAG